MCHPSSSRTISTRKRLRSPYICVPSADAMARASWLGTFGLRPRRPPACGLDGVAAGSGAATDAPVWSDDIDSLLGKDEPRNARPVRQDVVTGTRVGHPPQGRRVRVRVERRHEVMVADFGRVRQVKYVS